MKYVENRELFNILCRLTDAEKDFLGLRYGLEMSNDEIAKMLNITPKAVSDRYARLLNKCRKIHEKIFLKNFLRRADFPRLESYKRM